MKGGVEEEAINEKMKVLEVKSSDSEAESQSRKRGRSKFRVLVTGLVAGAKKVDALRQHFEKCGSIERMWIDDVCGHGYIDFTSLGSLKMALQLDKTICGHPVNIYRLFDKRSIFRVVIRGFDTGARELDVLGALRDHFKICGDIEDISLPSPEYAYIDFVQEDSLYRALELNNTIVRKHCVTVKKAYSCPSQYRAEIHGFDTGAGAEKVHMALRRHFQTCGWIEEISVNDDGFAYIAFASLDSLFKALEYNNTTVDGHTVTVRQPGFNFHTSRFRADISWSRDIDLEELWPHFEKWRGIAGIRYGRCSARIEFTNSASLNNALKITSIGDHKITVKECFRFCGGSNLRVSDLRNRSGMNSNFDN